MLVIMVLYGTTWEPQFAIHYQTEAQCEHRVHDYQVKKGSLRKAMCVPPSSVEISTPDVVTLQPHIFVTPTIETTEK